MQENMLIAEDRITFSWSNLSVEVPGSANKRCCGILPSRGDPKPPKQILKNGRKYYVLININMYIVQLVELFVQGSFLPSWVQVVLGNQLFLTPFCFAIWAA
jgi:hypothetical protein